MIGLTVTVIWIRIWICQIRHCLTLSLTASHLSHSQHDDTSSTELKKLILGSLIDLSILGQLAWQVALHQGHESCQQDKIIAIQHNKFGFWRSHSICVTSQFERLLAITAPFQNSCFVGASVTFPYRARGMFVLLYFCFKKYIFL